MWLLVLFYLALQGGNGLGCVPSPLEHADAPVPAGGHDPKLHVVEPRDRDVGRLAGHGHRVHDGEGLRVQDVDGRGLGAEDEAAHGSLLGVGLLQGGDASDDRLSLQREPTVQLYERLNERKCRVSTIHLRIDN